MDKSKGKSAARGGRGTGRATGRGTGRASSDSGRTPNTTPTVPTPLRPLPTGFTISPPLRAGSSEPSPDSSHPPLVRFPLLTTGDGSGPSSSPRPSSANRPSISSRTGDNEEGNHQHGEDGAEPKPGSAREDGAIYCRPDSTGKG